MTNKLSDERLSEFIRQTTGLHFPRERWADLQRCMAVAAHELGFKDAETCAGRWMSAPPSRAQVEIMASYLTIGETYFFRDRKTFEALTECILPELINTRRNGDRRLRIWSAACCTGEEAYSLAILLHQVIPDLASWHVTIMATDINPRFLKKAREGRYSEWSFRDAPALLKERYFSRTADGRYAIIPEIKKLVSFAYLNLAADVYPSLVTNTNAMDVIFCRNALIYFALPQVSTVIQHFHSALVAGGCLVVSPSEASRALFPQFDTVNCPGVILYQKSDGARRTEQQLMSAHIGDAAECVGPVVDTPAAWASPPALLTMPSTASMAEVAAPAATPLASQAVAEGLYRQGRHAEAVDTLLTLFSRQAPDAPDAPALSLLTRALANQGDLATALLWCGRWIDADKLDPSGHYLRAVLLLEQGDVAQARSSLQRTLYLQSDFVLAHFGLGNLSRAGGRNKEAAKHFDNALRLLRTRPPNDLLPEADGLTAGRLSEIITSMTANGNPS